MYIYQDEVHAVVFQFFSIFFCLQNVQSGSWGDM